MELAWQVCRLHGHLRRQLQKTDARISQSLCQPLAYRQRQEYSTAFYQLGNLPTGNRADAETVRLVFLNIITVILKQLHIAMHPPDPDVRVQDNHDQVFQSSSATGSVGRSYCTGRPRKA